MPFPLFSLTTLLPLSPASGCRGNEHGLGKSRGKDSSLIRHLMPASWFLHLALPETGCLVSGMTPFPSLATRVVGRLLTAHLRLPPIYPLLPLAFYPRNRDTFSPAHSKYSQNTPSKQTIRTSSDPLQVITLYAHTVTTTNASPSSMPSKSVTVFGTFTQT